MKKEAQRGWQGADCSELRCINSDGCKALSRHAWATCKPTRLCECHWGQTPKHFSLRMHRPCTPAGWVGNVHRVSCNRDHKCPSRCPQGFHLPHAQLNKVPLTLQSLHKIGMNLKNSLYSLPEPVKIRLYRKTAYRSFLKQMDSFSLEQPHT